MFRLKEEAARCLLCLEGACTGVPGRAAFTLVGVVDAARRVGPAPVVQMARAG